MRSLRFVFGLAISGVSAKNALPNEFLDLAIL